MSRREDHGSHTEADAAEFERWRGESYDTDPRPTRAECERDEYEAEAARREARRGNQ